MGWITSPTLLILSRFFSFHFFFFLGMDRDGIIVYYAKTKVAGEVSNSLQPVPSVEKVSCPALLTLLSQDSLL